MAWLNIIEYGDFYDVPHCVVVEHEGSLYAFDCPFDEHADDYAADYTVYRLAVSAREMAARRFTPWDTVLRLGEAVGRVPVSDVRFDAQHRYVMHDDAFRHL